jgi:hypothetical protein
LKRFGIEDAPSAHRLGKNAQIEAATTITGLRGGLDAAKKS